jgi:ferritin
MNDDVHEELNRQIRRELEAGYLYLSMSNYFEEENLPGFARWMRAQSEEEREHALRIVDHLQDRDARVTFEELESPHAEWDSPLDAVRSALEHEKKVSGHIHDLYDLAQEKGDHPARVMLEWFVEEQVEEERTFGDLVNHLERIDGQAAGLLVLDDQLGARGGA